MLDATTKRKIDSARNILVGKVPDPKAQVEQVTTGLVYKFMDDMDKESQEIGGKARFFTNGFEKFAWSNLLDPRLSGQGRLDLYVEAITRMSQNPHIPQLFRDIFKDAVLPYRDPQTLSLFLKEINDFTYDHSEKLGDAFEYLLSVLGSQGEAGQFRTPRHIIDFMVDVVGPKKDETILDPACGTAGFLISTYKHIMAQHDGKDDPDYKEVPLTPDEKKRLMNNIVGYDISPDMVRLSLVNMYLHGFPTPNISEYDTLTDEERWDDSYDVILANPPFMTPKGGIRPHKRFSIQANRSEVLFVDYIAEHLNPRGRGAVIVPEGIIFQAGNAYKSLRKMLVENYLYAVVSLPAGVFNPYSGVKTSILFFDKELSKHSEEILFVKINHDGFELGAQRRSHERNDLPEASSLLKAWQTGEVIESGIATRVSKESICESGDYNLSGDRFCATDEIFSSDWPIIKLKEVCKIATGRRDANHGSPDGKYPFFTCAKEPSLINDFSFDAEAILVAGNGDVGAVKYYKGKFDAYQRTYVLTDFQNIDAMFLYYVLQARLKTSLLPQKLGNTMPYIKLGMLQEFQFPLPSIEVQKQIVEELSGYQKIIDGAKSIFENWKPALSIDSSWNKVSLGDLVSDTRLGVVIGKKDQEKGSTRYLKMDSIKDGFIDLSKATLVDYKAKDDDYLSEGDFVYNTRNAPNLVGKSAVFHSNEKYLFNNNILRIRFHRDKVNADYVGYYMNSDQGKKSVEKIISGTTSVAAVYQKDYLKISILLPELDVQNKIVSEIMEERRLVLSAKKLVDIYEQKIQDKIAEVWGE